MVSANTLLVPSCSWIIQAESPCMYTKWNCHLFILSTKNTATEKKNVCIMRYLGIHHLNMRKRNIYSFNLILKQIRLFVTCSISFVWFIRRVIRLLIAIVTYYFHVLLYSYTPNPQTPPVYSRVVLPTYNRFYFVHACTQLYCSPVLPKSVALTHLLLISCIYILSCA